MKKLTALILSAAVIGVFIFGCENKEAKKADSNEMDLTGLSEVLLKSEIKEITVDHELYMGKIIKMDGVYYNHISGTNDGVYYHSIIIKKADLCCMVGFEFIWNGERGYPDDYPELYDKISITGKFSSYQEGDLTRYYLDVTSMEKK